MCNISIVHRLAVAVVLADVNKLSKAHKQMGKDKPRFKKKFI